ncbi:sodium channel protein Nach-like [Copidosoma floridanum]|uniref:sodium channel protein Nach-like n=1 Tax=Copidosoma floridanum TaxID=29053 RepID=UPI000C6FB6DF|nr:sodium channel protein Nach-like [Copidosoma floridanum]
MKSKNKFVEKRDRLQPEGKPSVWEILKQIYTEFASESTMHGIKYTTQARTTFEKVFWLIVVLISFALAVGLSGKFYDRHESANMRTTVVTSQYPSLKLPVPSITICQGNLVDNRRLEPFINREKRLLMPKGLTIGDFVEGLRYLRELIYPTNAYQEPLDKLQRILDLNGLSIPQLLELVSPTCADVLLVCVYENRNELCNKLFEPTITAYGICCSFNDASRRNTSIGHFRKGSPIGRDLFSTNFGTRYIISVLLRSYPDNETTASITYGDGYKILIHERHTLPGPNALEFMAGFALETIVGLQGTYLTSSPEVLNLPPHKRNCRVSTPKNIYRAENCFIEYQNQVVFERCNCLPFFANDVASGERLCNLTAIPCLARANSEIYSQLLHGARGNCLSDCESIKHSMTITGEPLNAIEFKPGSFYRKALEYPNSTALHVTFAGQAAVLERKELMLSWINLVSSLGGVFCLFLGCSFISIIEIAYFTYQLFKRIMTRYESNSSVINFR